MRCCSEVVVGAGYDRLLTAHSTLITVCAVVEEILQWQSGRCLCRIGAKQRTVCGNREEDSRHVRKLWRVHQMGSRVPDYFCSVYPVGSLYWGRVLSFSSEVK